MKPISLDGLEFHPAEQLKHFQKLMSLPRETIPALTVEETRRTLEAVARRIRLELVEIKHATPIFLLLPWGELPPRATLFVTWHGEALPVAPAALEGAERLAMATTLAAVEALAIAGRFGSPGTPEIALVVAPGATQGSPILDEALRGHRPRLQAPTAHWIRIAADAPRRRRVFLGARGRVVIGLWGGGANPYALRDRVIADLAEEAYGPRPLDFDLIRKLAVSADAKAFLAEATADAELEAGDWERRFRRALFEPRGEVLAPAVRHPARPDAWIIVSTAEAMEPEEILRRVASGAEGARAELAAAIRWDRLNIHHPAVQALIAMSKSRSEGPEIWPMSPWPTPSGNFNRALGIGLGEWAISLPSELPATALRFPSPDVFEVVSREVAELVLHALAESGQEPGREPGQEPGHEAAR